MKYPRTLLPPTDLSKVIWLSSGLLTTMRLLKSRGASDCTSTGELLAMQRFFREFEGWIKELDRWRDDQASLRETLRKRHHNQKAPTVIAWRKRM